MSHALFDVLERNDSDESQTDTVQTRVEPTPLSRGPWSPNALHGGPVATIVARAAETTFAHTFDGPYLPTRFTLDLERPVPLEPLIVTSSLTRPGRKVQVVEVSVTDANGARLAHGSVLAIRQRSFALPSELIQPDDELPSIPPDEPSSFAGWGFPTSDIAYHQDATEHRLVQGALGRPGPVIDWIRLSVPVVAGETPSPFQRVAAASDFLNGVSWTLSGAEWIFINPDLTITLHRLPVGEHVAVDAVTRIDANGTGTAEANLFDVHGRIGRAVQTLLVEHR